MVGAQRSPTWLMVEGLLGRFAHNRAVARHRYESFVAEGIGARSVWTGLKRQIYLGDARFVERMQAKLGQDAHDGNIPRAQRRRPARPLACIAG